MKIEFTVVAPKVVEVKGGGWHGVFESTARAHAWIEARMSGKPYSPIPKPGEA